MAKVIDIDSAFEDHIRSEYSAKTFLNTFKIEMDDLRNTIIVQSRYDSARNDFIKEEFEQCHKCKEYYDDPKDTAYVIDADTDEEYSLCQECHTKISKRDSESQQEKAGA